MTILLITNRSDITTDVLVSRLQEREIPYFRLNTELFPSQLSIHIKYDPHFSGFLYDKHSRERLEFREIRSVYYRRPFPPNPRVDCEDIEKGQFALRESYQALSGMFGNLKCFWVSRPASIIYAENKVTQLEVAKQIGFAVPRTVISSSADEIIDFIKSLDYQAVVKPVKSGFVGSSHLIFTTLLDPTPIEPERLSVIPSIYQEFIKKQYDIRVTVVGDRVFPVEIHSQVDVESRIDWRESPNPLMVQREHLLPGVVAERCVRIVKHFGLSFGAIDLAVTEAGEYFFLEINPNGQWAWIERRTTYKLSDAIIDLLVSCGNES